MRFIESFGSPEIPDAPREVRHLVDLEAEAAALRARKKVEAEERERGEQELKKQQEKVAAKRNAEQDAREKLAAVARNRSEDLKRAAEQHKEAVEAIRDRCGDERQRSFDEIDLQIETATRLRQDSERKARDAAGGLLPREVTEQIREDADKTERTLRELRQLRADLKREERLEEDHIERAGIEGVEGRDCWIVSKVIHIGAEILANHVVPGFGGVIVNFTEIALQLTGVLGNPDNIDGVEVSIPLTVYNGLINIGIGVKLDDNLSGNDGTPITLSIDPDIGYNFPSITFIENNPDHQGTRSPEQPELPEQPEAREPAQSEPTKTAGPPVTAAGSEPVADSQMPEEPGAEAVRPRDSRPDLDAESPGRDRSVSDSLSGATQSGAVAEAQLRRFTRASLGGPGGAQATEAASQSTGATAAVICGSAAALATAAGTPDLDSDLILSFARQAAIRHFLNGTASSVAAAVRAASNLEVVVFFDPELRMGLWIDVNPVSQRPAATLLIMITTVQGQLVVRCYRSGNEPRSK